MPIRVTQHTMYNNMVGSMQSSLANYMNSIEQGSSQKKVNRPSDDPAGVYRILTTRQDITNTEQYQENVDTAKGWLNLADNVLSTQVATAITGLKTLAEQASTGTYDAGQRKIMADQARQYFGQLLNLSNTEFEGKSIFAGHKYGANAFEEGLAVTSWDENWANLQQSGAIQVHGASDSTIMVQFTTEPAGKAQTLSKDMTFRWSKDGEHWENGAVQENGKNFELFLASAGVTITLPQSSMNAPDKDNPADDPGSLSVIGYDSTQPTGPNNGTMLYLRPAAFYKGDDNDLPIEITVMGAQGTLTKDNVKAEGVFGQNVIVRVDGHEDNGKLVDVNGTTNKDFYWSYSTDGGTTWITQNKGVADGNTPTRLPIPGGYVDIDPGTIKAGTQILVHPARADLGYEIMKDTYLPVNSVGKDVFGGIYDGVNDLKGDDNLFEVVGAFIGYLETNNQEGCQRTLAALTTAEKKVLAEATRIGGMENRLSLAADVLSYQKIDQQERLSYVEDIDLTELLTKLTRQQMTYQTVLQSSSMIMQMSLAKYL